MANLRPIVNKDGEVVSYQIRVHRGRDSEGRQLTPYCTTWKVPDKMKTKSEEYILEKAKDFAATYEAACKAGIVADNRQRFDEYAEDYLQYLVRKNASAETIDDYRERLVRINAEIGYLKLTDITGQRLNKFYDKLLKEGARVNSERAYAKVDLKQFIKEHNLRMQDVCDRAHISDSTLRDAVNGKPLLPSTAKKIAEAIGVSVKDIFRIQADKRPLSNITVIGYHRVISAIFGLAYKEGLIKDNPASRASPPSSKSQETPNYLQPDEVLQVINALLGESIFWRAMIYLFIFTGARRGEILGLTWDDIDFAAKTIEINKSVSASKSRGIYVHATKTSSSVRTIDISESVVDLLQGYKEWYDNECERYNITGGRRYLFERLEENGTGMPCHPSSVNHYLIEFTKKNGIKHINPHAFRHTCASILLREKTDVVTVGYILGHAKPGTTLNMYGHFIKGAGIEASKTLDKAIFGSKD